MLTLEHVPLMVNVLLEFEPGAMLTAVTPAGLFVNTRLSMKTLASRVVLIVGPLIFPAFVNQTLARIGVFAVAVLGLNVVMGYTGQVSLGQIFFVGLGAYVTAYGVSQDWNIVVVFVLASGIAFLYVRANFRSAKKEGRV